MAFLFMRAKIVKASSGRSVVAAAAYQAAEKLHDEKLGMTFQYRHKEEVVFSEKSIKICIKRIRLRVIMNFQEYNNRLVISC